MCMCVCMRVCVSLSSSMENYPFVGLNALHVDAVLLLSDDHRPPEPGILLLLLSTGGGDGLAGLTARTPAARPGL